MKWTIAPPVLMGVGLFLMIAGFVWPRVVGPSVWSEEQAKRLSRAGADIHRLQYEHAFAQEGEDHPPQGGPRRFEHVEADPSKNAEGIKAELDKAHQDWERAQKELGWARTKRNLPAHVLWWLGAVSCCVGVAGHFVLRTEWARRYIEA
jgi:hypothetical protein